MYYLANDAYGWIAALYALTAMGTYGVSIKETRKLQVDPLVFQSFKTFVMVFISPVVLLMGATLKFTPFGLLSGFLWVVGGSAGVAAVRLAGMALAVGVWSSVMVLMSFVVGILFFHEPVANLTSTTAAFGLLTIGLIGMSQYGVSDTNKKEPEENKSVDEEQEALLELMPNPSSDESDDLSVSESSTVRRIRSENVVDVEAQPDIDKEPLRTDIETKYQLFGKELSKEALGIIAAVANGVLSGAALIPVHYAKKNGFGGAQYFMSYALGALITNVCLWVVYYSVLIVRAHFNNKNNMTWKEKAIHAGGQMPAWHMEKLWKAGLCGGFLASSAMLGNIISVTYLGQGIGSSVCQAKIIVSGLWGIFYYKEIRNRDSIRKWFLSASLCMFGIIWLSLERLAAKNKVY